MSENRYIEKFQSKTDSELEYILENKKDYNPQAVEASIYILKERNGKTAVLESVENEIKVEQEKKKLARENAVAESKKKSNITDDLTAPQLHSKKVIMIFSGLFATIFGTVLLMYNMKQTNNKVGRIQVLIFGIFYTILTIIIVNFFDLSPNLTICINIAGGAILSEYFWNKFIGKDFKYRRRSWIKPAIISVIITIPFVLALLYTE